MGILLSLSSLVLTACGGSSDSESNSNSQSKLNNHSQNNETHIYAVDYSQDRSSDSLELSYLEVKNNKIVFSDSNSPIGEYILTEKKLYQPNDLAENVIYLDGLTKWTINGVGTLKNYQEFKQVNLSNKNIFDTVLPGFRQLPLDALQAKAHFFLNGFGNQKFPAGSSCYRLISQKQSEPFISFSPFESNMLNQNFDDFDRSNEMYFNSFDLRLGISYKKVSSQWQSIPWTTIYNKISGESLDGKTVVQFENKLYNADYFDDLEYKAVEEVKFIRALIPQVQDPSILRDSALRLADLESGCSFYNETAANALSQIAAIQK